MKEQSHTYWIRLHRAGYLSYNGGHSYNINDIRDFGSFSEALTISKKYKDSKIWRVGFSFEVEN